MKLLYHVTIAAEDSRRLLHRRNCESFLAVVNAVEDVETFTAYHLHDGKHYVPDYAAIREALPGKWKPAWDRMAGSMGPKFWFPATLISALSEVKDNRNGCNKSLFRANGTLIGTIYATPYLFKDSLT